MPKNPLVPQPNSASETEPTSPACKEIEPCSEPALVTVGKTSAEAEAELCDQDDETDGTAMSAEDRERLVLIEEAIQAERKVNLSYIDAKKTISERVIRPLWLMEWSRTIALIAWCEHREDFRLFRLDRLISADLLDETFRSEPLHALYEYVERLRRNAEGEDSY